MDRKTNSVGAGDTPTLGINIFANQVRPAGANEVPASKLERGTENAHFAGQSDFLRPGDDEGRGITGVGGGSPNQMGDTRPGGSEDLNWIGHVISLQGSGD